MKMLLIKVLAIFSVFVAIITDLGVLCAPTQDECTRLKQNTFDLLLSVKESCDDQFRDCCQIAKGAKFLSESKESGVYDIANVCTTGQQPFLSHAQSITVLQARCDLQSNNGGWLVILRRKADVSPQVNFRRSWAEYENGFGNLQTEFWYGLKNINCLTSREAMEMMIELKLDNDNSEVWTYQQFTVGGPDTNYVLRIGGAQRVKGSSSDQLSYYNNRPFSTIDRDNDGSSSFNCAAHASYGNGGGWWWNNCNHAALTRPHTGTNKIFWAGTVYNYYPHVEMKIRPKTCF